MVQASGTHVVFFSSCVTAPALRTAIGKKISCMWASRVLCKKSGIHGPSQGALVGDLDSFFWCLLSESPTQTSKAKGVRTQKP